MEPADDPDAAEGDDGLHRVVADAARRGLQGKPDARDENRERGGRGAPYEVHSGAAPLRNGAPDMLSNNNTEQSRAVRYARDKSSVTGP